MNKIILNQNFEFNYNPFSGLENHEIQHALVAQFDIPTIVQQINNHEPLLIEFVGKQGRGKTTHLTHLQQHLQQYPIFLLNASSNYHSILEHPSDIVFIDSIHHIPFIQRIKIYKTKRVVIFTTHWTRKWESLFSKKTFHQIQFSGITQDKLSQIIQNRIELAIQDKNIDIQLNQSEIKRLIKIYGDDYRGIINHLYDKFQQNERLF